MALAEQAITETSTLVAGVLVRTIDGLELAAPTVGPDRLAAIDGGRAALLAEG